MRLLFDCIPTILSRVYTLGIMYEAQLIYISEKKVFFTEIDAGMSGTTEKVILKRNELIYNIIFTP